MRATEAATVTKTIYTVKQINRAIRDSLEGAFPPIWVQGEIANLSTPASKHIYFSLKEEKSVLRCVYFRNQQLPSHATPKSGLQVLVHAQIVYYEPNGDVQLQVTYIEDAGAGALWRAYEALKKKLEAEGLFNPQHKQPLPAYPRTLGVLTSASGAVWHDIIVSLQRRYPAVTVVLIPASVQGAEAPASIVAAIARAETHPAIDTLIVARGGGSMDDLNAFNDEQVVRRLFHCRLPTISAIGHATDFTLCDFVADARAATPTAAAISATPDRAELQQTLATYRARLAQHMQYCLNQRQQNLDHYTARLTDPARQLDFYRREHQWLAKQLHTHWLNFAHAARNRQVRATAALHQHSPQQRLNRWQPRLAHCHIRLCDFAQARIRTLQQRTAQLRAMVLLLDPTLTLRRGYAIVRTPDQRIVTAPQQVAPGARLMVQVADGQFGARVDAADDASRD